MTSETPIYDALHEEWLVLNEGREPGVLSPEEIARYPVPEPVATPLMDEDRLECLLS